MGVIPIDPAQRAEARAVEGRAAEIDEVKDRLAVSKAGKILNNEGNLERVLTEDPLFIEGLVYNEFSGVIEWQGEPLTDQHVTEIRLGIGRTYEFTPSVARAAELVAYCARKRARHPLREWLSGLVWDGEPRLAGLLATYAGAEDTALNAEIGLRFAISAVARVYQPGAKVDTTLILAGPQGAGKSTFFRVLAGAAFFRDTPIDMRNKDAYLALRGAWLYEMAELASMRPRDAETVKAFLSAQVDHFRPPYGRFTVENPRQCIFVGTTNETGFLNDPTGARRFWPVGVSGSLDLEGLAAVREQLWAEAVERYEAGERWWLLQDTEDDLRGVHEHYTAEDPWAPALKTWLTGKVGGVTICEILTSCMEVEVGKQHKAMEMRLGGLLTAMGYHRKRRRVDGERTWVWERK